MRIIPFACALVLSASGIALAAPPAGCDDLRGQPINFNVKWPQVWQAWTEQSNCTQNCHLGGAPSGDLDLSSLMISIYFLVGQSSSQAPDELRIDPGFARRSLLFHKINCSSPGVGGRMPPGGSMSPALQGLVYDWIAQGARGESPKDPISRDFLFSGDLESLRR